MKELIIIWVINGIGLVTFQQIVVWFHLARIKSWNITVSYLNSFSARDYWLTISIWNIVFLYFEFFILFTNKLFRTSYKQSIYNGIYKDFTDFTLHIGHDWFELFLHNRMKQTDGYRIRPIIFLRNLVSSNHLYFPKFLYDWIN